jgi:hypothetical protein
MGRYRRPIRASSAAIYRCIGTKAMSAGPVRLATMLMISRLLARPAMAEAQQVSPGGRDAAASIR